MTDNTPPKPAAAPQQDERNHPVYKAGQAVAKFMAFVWALVVLVVLYLTFRFWTA